MINISSVLSVACAQLPQEQQKRDERASFLHWNYDII